MLYGVLAAGILILLKYIIFIKRSSSDKDMSFLDPVLNPVLQPLLNASPVLVVIGVSFLVSVLITLVYKYMTNQADMKQLKDQQKEFQKRMKELRSNPDEMMKVQKEAMKANMEYMKHSLKPTLVTMLPIILIFTWMAGHMSFEPIYPGEVYSVTAAFKEGAGGKAELQADDGTTLLSEPKQEIKDGSVTWNLKSTDGNHVLTVKLGEAQQQKKVLITKELKYEEQVSLYKHSDVERITVNYNKLKPLGPDFTVPLFNWQPGWLGIYFIFSIVFSLGLRKLLKIY